MPQLVEIRGLSQAEAEERAANFGIDAIQVDTIKEADGTFTVRATYPDGMVVPGATPVSTTPAPGDAQPPAGEAPAAPGAGPAGATIVSDSAGGFAIKGLTKAAADEEAAFFRDSGSTVDVVAEGATFTVRRRAARSAARAATSPCAAARRSKCAGSRRLCFLS